MKKWAFIFLLMNLILGIQLSPQSVSAADSCSQYRGVKHIWWDGAELKKGQIGRLTVKQDTPLYKVSGETRTFARTLKAGEFYRIYAFKPGMLSVGGGYYVDRDAKISYETPSKTKLEAVRCINTPADTTSTGAGTVDVCDQYKGVKHVWWNGMELKQGQIGRLTVKQATTLYKVSGETRTPARTLKAGEFYRIYAFKPGSLSVGGGYYVDRDAKVTYETPSKAKLAAARCINIGYAETPMKVTFIDVGQGDSILINLPNGKNMLVDGGKRDAQDKVGSYLRKMGIKSLDVVVSTHPDADHIGGLIDVLNFFSVRQVLDSGKGHTTQTYIDLLGVIDTKNIPFKVAQVGQTVDLDPNVKITVLNSGEAATDNNDASVSLKISYGNIDVLLTGDAETEQEKVMMAKFNVEAEIFKAAHHGSITGNSLEFLQKVQPDAAVLSYGAGNSYGHPDPEVVARLKQVGSKIYSTADSGDIVFTISRSSFKVAANPSFVANNPGTGAGTGAGTGTGAGAGTGAGTGTATGAATGKLRITSKNLSTEIVGITNDDTKDLNLSGWKLVSVNGNQTFTFPQGFVLGKGKTVYITSGPKAKESRPTYLKWTTGSIWNNSGDAAQLKNPAGAIISAVK